VWTSALPKVVAWQVYLTPRGPHEARFAWEPGFFATGHCRVAGGRKARREWSGLDDGNVTVPA
jgi:hypothetical protein